MEVKSDYQAKIHNIAKMLPAEKLGEVLDFMEFLYRKEKGFNYTTVENSAEYVQRLREEESFTPEGNQKDGREFLKELIEWQESNSYIDTDIFIDCLKGISPAKAVFRSSDIDIYCSVLTEKELLNKPGLKVTVQPLSLPWRELFSV